MNTLKKVILGFLVSCTTVVLGETYTWTGVADNAWDNAANWEGGKAFVSSLDNDLVINKAGAPIPNNTQMHDLTLNASVTLDYKRIDVSGNICCVAGDINFRFNGGINLKGNGSTFDLSGGSVSFLGTNPYCSIEGEGVGLTLTKNGDGGKLDLGSKKGHLNVTGPLVIENGVVLEFPSNSTPEEVDKLKATDVTVTGAGSQLQLGHSTNITQEAEIKLVDEATLKVPAGVQIVIRSLVIDGKKCAPGAWGGPGSAGVDRLTLRVVGGGSVLVTDKDGTYEGGDLWTGKTATWLRSAGTDSLTTPGNWKDGYLPHDYDDIVFDANCSGQKMSDANVHNFTINAQYTSDGYWNSTINLTSGFYVGQGGSLSAHRCSAGFNLSAGQVVFEIAEGGSVKITGLQNEYFRLSGVGGLTMRGASNFSWDNGTKFTFTGPLVVESGTLKFPALSAEVATETVVVTGATAVVSLQFDNQLNTNTVLTLKDGGKMSVSSGKRQLVKEMWIDGQKCASGTWGMPASGAEHSTLRIGGDGLIEVWGEGGDYEGGDVWTGDTRTWTGAVDKDWKNVGNWKEGIVPVAYDDIIVDVEMREIPSNFPKPLVAHNLVINAAVTWPYCNEVQVSGGIFCKSGDIKMTYSGTLTLLSPETVLDVTGGSILLSPTTSQTHTLGGNGGLVLRRGAGGTGELLFGNDSKDHCVFRGPLRVEGGATFTPAMADGPLQTHDVTVTGEGSVVKFKGVLLPTDSTVRLENGGKAALIGNFTNDIAYLVLDGSNRAKRTYGGVASPAKSKLEKYFVEKEGDLDNMGVFNVTVGNGSGLMIFIR